MTDRLDQMIRRTVTDLATQARGADLTRTALAKGRSMRRRRLAITAGAAATATAIALLTPSVLHPDGDNGLALAEPTSSPSASPEDVFTHTFLDANRPMELVDGWIILGSKLVYDRSRGAYVSVVGDQIYPSPTGTKVAAISDEQQNRVEVTDFRTGSSRTFDVGPSWEPQWSPDGTRLLFTVMPKDDPVRLEIVVLDVASGSTTRHTVDWNTYQCNERCQFTWLPSGLEIALALTDKGLEHDEAQPDRERGLQIFTTDGVPTRLVPVPGWVAGPHAWSPDGRRAVVSGTTTVDGKREGQPQIVDVVTGEVIQALASSDAYWVDNDRLLCWEFASIAGATRPAVTLRTREGVALERWVPPEEVLGHTPAPALARF